MPEHIAVSTMRLPDGSRLLTGRVIDAGVRLSEINAEAMAAALLAGMVLTLLSALLLARIFSRQVEGIVRTTAAISGGALADRVPVDGSGDAFDALGEAINAMLDRIESLVSELRLMTDGLAHDLKSPVTRLKSVLEHAILETDDPTASAALEKVAREAETLLAMLTTALLISRTQAGIGRDQRKETDLGALLLDLAEVYGPLAEDHGFALETQAEAGLCAPLHRELTSQAIGNLIENALNYAAGGTRITLSATMAAGMLQLAVGDDGPGIPASQRAEALRRFGRLDPARHVAGSGLGLSLVDAVARLHDGHVALEDNAPGPRVVLTLAV
jgi:signal transduction histidine kinase